MIGKHLDCYSDCEDVSDNAPDAYQRIEPLPGAPKPLLGALILAGSVGAVIFLCSLVILPFFARW